MDSLLHQFADEHSLLVTASEMAYATATDPNNNQNDFETTTITNTTTTITPPPPTAAMANKSGGRDKDKYSLRPRSMRRLTEAALTDEDIPDTKRIPSTLPPSRTTPSTPATPPSTKSSKKNYKPKQKPAPLSKYRRKTANARERNRMREINQAFETLRRVIPAMSGANNNPAPPPPTSSAMSATNEKLTKITTLRLAMKYISALSAALQQEEKMSDGSSSASSSSSTTSGTYSFALDSTFFGDCNDLDCLLLESDGESLPLSEHSSASLLTSPDFPDGTSLSPVDFGDPDSLSPLLHTDYDHTDFSDFLLT